MPILGMRIARYLSGEDLIVTNASQQKSEIGRAILAYLDDNRKAGDTLEGIAHWWLLEQNIKYQIKIVKEVLDELVGTGHIVAIKRKNIIHYRRIK
jgi:hypothetical protein